MGASEINFAYSRHGNLREFQTKVSFIKQNEAHIDLFYKGTALTALSYFKISSISTDNNSHEEDDGDKLKIIKVFSKVRHFILVLFTFCIPFEFNSEIIPISSTFCL